MKIKIWSVWNGHFNDNYGGIIRIGIHHRQNYTGGSTATDKIHTGKSFEETVHEEAECVLALASAGPTEPR